MRVSRRKKKFQKPGSMDLCITVKGVSFLLQTGLGILGNASVLMAYAHIAFIESHMQPVDRILAQLAFSNLLMLLTRGVPLTMFIFGLHNLVDDPGCKVLIYGFRLSRALSICLTSMLSVFQALTLAPSGGPHLTKLKSHLSQLVVPTFIGLWLLNMIICIAAPLFSIAPRNGTVPPFTLNLGFCHVNFHDNLSYVVNGVVFSTRDFAFVAIMLVSSGYILILLHKHSRQVRSIRRVQQGTSMETRAAKTVVMLVVLYTVFFGIDNLIWIYMLTVDQVPGVVADMRVFFTSCYATFSPFLMISTNKKIKERMVCAVGEQTAKDSTENTK
ncbi:olfactory receptor class A-like protein 1 [Clarias gariepinus]|uniref:olfactory receptor class A-like protein 1 n=1 Tax=Clarias gariepinus TaxID=13013 RepID=UPI00234C422A|nr:olfactory receptor class A-like protein 1 [Clarias gariepinus]